MQRTKRVAYTSVATSMATGLALAVLANAGAGIPALAQDTEPTVTVRQEEGKTVYWVLPGPRKLSEQTFGTADNPKTTLKPKLKMAETKVKAGKMPPSVPQLLKDLPILVAVPEKARKKGPDGSLWLKQPTPFSDKGEIIQGSFTAQFWDKVETDPPGPPGKTSDKAAMTAEFTDPAGNEYRIELDHVVKPPFPGYKTGGGVLVDATHHGTTGTGTPLMPKVDTIAAWWGVGDLYINGELEEKKRVMHSMTTEVVRTKDYHLALPEEMSLAPDERFIKGQEHHTHLIVLPVKATKKGPVFEPVPTAFELPNGKTQPFMHVMYEEDTVTK